MQHRVQDGYDVNQMLMQQIEVHLIARLRPECCDEERNHAREHPRPQDHLQMRVAANSIPCVSLRYGFHLMICRHES